MGLRCALYCRVSTEDQTTENQIQPLRDRAKSKGYTIVKEYVETGSGAKKDREQFCLMLDEADKRTFDLILVWALDRFSREGVSNMVAYINRLKRAGVGLESKQEEWLDISDEGPGQVLLFFMAWIAKQERKRLSERVRAGMKRAKDGGAHIGRPDKSKDKGRRRTSGYCLSWQSGKRKKPQRKQGSPVSSLSEHMNTDVIA